VGLRQGKETGRVTPRAMELLVFVREGFLTRSRWDIRTIGALLAINSVGLNLNLSRTFSTIAGKL
jgi:hypothetical protein